MAAARVSVSTAIRPGIATTGASSGLRIIRPPGAGFESTVAGFPLLLFSGCFVLCTRRGVPDLATTSSNPLSCRAKPYNHALWYIGCRGKICAPNAACTDRRPIIQRPILNGGISVAGILVRIRGFGERAKCVRYAPRNRIFCGKNCRQTPRRFGVV